MIRHKLLVSIVCLLTVVSLVVFTFLYVSAYTIPTSLLLNYQITIQFKDGSTLTLSSNRNLLTDILNKLTLSLDRNKEIENIIVDVYVYYSTLQRDKPILLQAWYQFYTSISGVYADGLREYNPLTGFFDAFVNSYYDTQQTSRWILIYNNPGLSWTGLTDFVKYFYVERGTGLQMGLLNIGPEYAYQIVQALKTHVVTYVLAKQLTGLLGSVKYMNGDEDQVITWSMSGGDMINYLKRMDWKGFAIHLGSFTVGLGKWVRMHDNDQYTIKFKLAYIYRYYFLKWSDWKAGESTIATLTIKILRDKPYLINAEVGSPINLVNAYKS